MKSLRIFISSPGDVAEEREKARKVVEALQRHYGEEVRLIPVLWEELAIPASASFQEGIDRLLQERHRVDVAVFILWSRLGSPLGGALIKRDGTPYRSGTERELDMMLEAHARSGGRGPAILAYTRDDEKGFSERLDAERVGVDQLEEMIGQRKLVREFIREKFHDEQGRNLRAYHTYREPVGFAQRLHVHLREILDGLLGMDGGAVVWEGPPYPGLRVFATGEAEVFFGREEETCAILARLRERQAAGCGFVCVVGSSGSGKSSLARAGVAATLKDRSFDEAVRDWRVAEFVPGESGGEVFGHLARRLAEALPTVCHDGGEERLARCLAEGNFEAAGILLGAASREADSLAGGPVRVLLLLDQMEELWGGSGITPEQREAFLAAVDFLTRSGKVAVLGTLRSDFYSAAQQSTAFLKLKGADGQYDLVAPGPGALRAIILRPARKAGLEFERGTGGSPPLDEVILADALKDPEALPLLQFALAGLYDHREEGSRKLTFAAYREMGGVEGALGHSASKALARLPGEIRAGFEGLLPHLVAVDSGRGGQRKTVRRRAPLSLFGADPQKQRLVEELVAARFLVASDGGDGPVVALAHDALLRRWSGIEAWLEKNQSLLAMRARLEQCLAMWEEGGRDASRLLAPGAELREGLDLLEKAPEMVPREARDFVLLSRQKARRAAWIRWGAAAAVLAVAAGIALAWWDHTRLRTARFAFLSSHYGVPVGVGPLKPDAAAKRESSYLVATSRNKVRRVSHVNGSGTPVPDPASPLEAAVRVVHYYEDGSLDSIAFETPGGRLLVRHRFGKPQQSQEETSSVLVKFEGEQGESATQAAESGGFSKDHSEGESGQRSEITAHRLTFDAQGLLVRRMHLNHYNTPRGDAEGVFGMEFENDASGLLVRQTMLDENSRPRPSRNGVQTQRLSRDSNGQVVETTHLDKAGNPVLLKVGFSGWTTRFDEYGNEVEKVYFDANGQPVADKNGVAKTTTSYDDSGNPVETAFFDIDGKPVFGEHGYAKKTRNFDERGNEIETAYFGVDGPPVLHKDGYARISRQFDERGNPIQTAYFGMDGQPVLHKDGYAQSTSRFDERGNEIEICFLGVNGEPVLQKEGVAKITSQFDERGNEVERDYFGVDGQPVLIKDGYAKWTAKFDERGNPIQIAYFGMDGQPVLHKDGYAKWTTRFDERGNKVEIAYFGVQDELVLTRDFIAIRKNEYDGKGNLIEKSFFDTQRKPTLSSHGTAKETYAYNDWGHVTEHWHFGINGEPVICTHGIHRRSSQTDPLGREIKVSAYGVDGKLMSYDDGSVGWKTKFDERGNKIEVAFFGVDGQPVLHKDGYAKITSEFDERGNENEVAFFGVDGQPVLIKEGYTKSTSQFDERGNQIEVAYFGVEGLLALNSLGYAKSISRFDERGNQIESTHFGVDGEPVLSKEGYFKWTSEFDERGNEVKTAFFGVDGQPVLDKDGVAKWTSKFDERGNEVKTAYFGVDGQPVLDKNGVAKILREFDSLGRQIKTTRLGTDGKTPVLGKDGYAGWTNRFDERGNKVEVALFGVDGQPVLAYEGTAKWTNRFDDRGNEIEVAYFGVEGLLALNSLGYAKSISRFDERGNQIEAAFFGADGQPVLIKDGFAKWTSKFDERGNEIETAFFGVDGTPVANVHGLHRRVQRFDALGNEVESLRFGPGGEPVANDLGYHRAVRVFDARSNLVREEWWGTDGYRTINTETGSAIREQSLNARGEVVETRHLGVEEKPVLGQEGYAKSTHAYDERGNEIETAYFGVNGEPVLHKNGYAKITRRFDAKGDPVEELHFGLHGESITPPE